MSGLNANLPLVGEAEGANAGDSLPGEAILKYQERSELKELVGKCGLEIPGDACQ
jgi:hypothetical protein